MHSPVLKDEVINVFKTQKLRVRNFFEGTFGRGGHTLEILKNFPDVVIYSFDKDESAIEFGRANFSSALDSKQLHLIRDDFNNLQNHKLAPFDAALIDLGVSSPQLDEASRGFSFAEDGPLDMRMNQRQDLKASDIVNTWDAQDLSDLFYNSGEVKFPNKVVRAIVADRRQNPFMSTRQLASLIERVDGFRKGGHHPATKYFLALRVFVNQELENLKSFIEELPSSMNLGGRVAVITFHSLEDRIVKNAFKTLNRVKGHIVNKKVIIASPDEIKSNPRSRSAKLRVFEVSAEMGGSDESRV